jgi:hypothetical protein
MKPFVKALVHMSYALQHTRSMFCQVFEAEVKSEIFIETRITYDKRYNIKNWKQNGTCRKKFLTGLSVGGGELAMWHCE